MNKTQFYQEIKNFDSLKETNSDLNNIIQQYPYFLLARLVQAKTKRTDVNTLTCLFPDRKYLYSLITKENFTSFVQEEKTENHLQEIKNEPIVKETIIETKKEETTDLQSILQQRLNEIKNSSPSTNINEQTEKTNEEFVDKNSTEEKVSLDELIEKFNTNYTKISCSFEDSEENETYEDLCKNSIAEKMNIVSETLANIYKEQGQYDKAIKIYKTLMTRYPEKNSTFATLIEELKQIKNSQQL